MRNRSLLVESFGLQVLVFRDVTTTYRIPDCTEGREGDSELNAATVTKVNQHPGYAIVQDVEIYSFYLQSFSFFLEKRSYEKSKKELVKVRRRLMLMFRFTVSLVTALEVDHESSSLCTVLC